MAFGNHGSSAALSARDDSINHIGCLLRPAIAGFHYTRETGKCLQQNSACHGLLYWHDPDSEKPVTGFVAINHKAILGNHDNYRLFVDNILLDFPKRLNMNDISRACTIAHGQLLLQAQPENSLWAIKQRKQTPPTPFRDVPQASVCVSYPKDTGFGPLDPYVQEAYIVTSLSKMTDVLCENCTTSLIRVAAA